MPLFAGFPANLGENGFKKLRQQTAPSHTMACKPSILITGCSSGCGLDAAFTLKARGWRVFAACRKERDCEELRDQGLESPRIDYNDELSITTGYQQVLDATGGTLDALYNNGAFAML